MDSKRNIPSSLQDKINAMPECSYGLTRIRVILDDGSRFNDVFVAWGNEIVKVGTSEQLPFDASRIVDVERS